MRFVALVLGPFARAKAISQLMGKVGSAYVNSVAETICAKPKEGARLPAKLAEQKRRSSPRSLKTTSASTTAGGESCPGWASLGEFEDRDWPVRTEAPRPSRLREVLLQADWEAISRRTPNWDTIVRVRALPSLRQKIPSQSLHYTPRRIVRKSNLRA